MHPLLQTRGAVTWTTHRDPRPQCQDPLQGSPMSLSPCLRKQDPKRSQDWSSPTCPCPHSLCPHITCAHPKARVFLPPSQEAEAAQTPDSGILACLQPCQAPCVNHSSPGLTRQASLVTRLLDPPRAAPGHAVCLCGVQLPVAHVVDCSGKETGLRGSIDRFTGGLSPTHPETGCVETLEHDGGHTGWGTSKKREDRRWQSDCLMSPMSSLHRTVTPAPRPL